MNLDLQTPPAAGDSATANEEIRRRNLDVLTPQRAVRFIEKHVLSVAQIRFRAVGRKIRGPNVRFGFQ